MWYNKCMIEEPPSCKERWEPITKLVEGDDHSIYLLQQYLMRKVYWDIMNDDGSELAEIVRKRKEKEDGSR